MTILLTICAIGSIDKQVNRQWQDCREFTDVKKEYDDFVNNLCNRQHR
nr:MAG TPA: hypothetical protein [Caudoviricetes sp.]